MDEDPCRTSFRHVCDPDRILSEEEVRRVQQELDDYPRSVTCEGKDVTVQVAVALVSKVRTYKADPSQRRHVSLSLPFVL
jgi:Modulator of levamisole receptor-1